MSCSKAPRLSRKAPDIRGLLAAPRRIPLVMGIVNVTPDSFYAGSRFSPQAAADEVLRQAEAGADLVDIGGQSTRPGSDPVPAEEELRRVAPVFAALAGKSPVPLSIDTDKARVACECLAAGAALLNDVSALRADPDMMAAAQAAPAVVLMHRGGDSPKTMQESPRYGDVLAEVKAFLAGRRDAFAAAGGDPTRLLYDPGIGFGKDLGHNLSLLKHLDELCALGPVVLGASRKSFLGKVTVDGGPQDRLEGSLAAACWAAMQGAAVVRVHDVAATRRALAALDAVLGAA
ncbi:MAG: dihydropteroate synthase [Elusimicrobia bacterium]|nr:dihydropteroate synthase [Elusimicrobiota bacterium]